MKKRIVITVCVLSLTAIVIFFCVWTYTKNQTKPLYGNFDIGMKCMGGHEIFLDLETSNAYENCPGHRDRKRINRVVRTRNSVTILDPRDDLPWFRVDWNGSVHSLSFLKRPDSQSLMGMIPIRGPIHQVTNPWRLWLPRLLPEE